MLTVARMSIVATLLSLPLAGCSISPEPPVDRFRSVVGTVHVSVQDEQERPLAGASVTGSALEETMTDRTGLAVARAYAPVTSLAVRPKEYEDVVVAQLSIPQGAPVRVVLKRRR
ncbi:MAG: hypothetical protein FJZ38_12420 [Candidatus Rokubacteria bacterium]|nr:hypothetical protein [Candidatus Rokubacteria bacterium]